MNYLFGNKHNVSAGINIKRVLQKKQVLKALYFGGAMSNAEIGKQLGVSAPKMNELLRELIQDNLVKDLGPGTSSGGRRPSIFGLVKNGFYLVGISIGIYKTGIAIFDASNNEVYTKIFSVKIEKNIQVFKKIKGHLDEVIEKSGINPSKIIAGGIEMPGLVNSEKGINKTYFPEYDNLHELIGQLFPFPMFFENDAKVRAYAEKHFGLAKKVDHALILNIDWGVGMGIIVEGNLYRGNAGFAGEFGHLPIVENGILCKCGKKGCLETVASATAIVRMAKEGILEGNSSLINEYTGDSVESIEIYHVINAAKAGDQFAISILSNVAHWIGKGIVFLIQIFNPEAIVLEGIASETQKFMEAPIQQAINTYSNHDISNETKIKFSKLGIKAGIKGAAALALEKLVMVQNHN